MFDRLLKLDKFGLGFRVLFAKSSIFDYITNFLRKMVRIAGLEPARVAPLPPQSSVSANSTICAYTVSNEAANRPQRKPILVRTPPVLALAKCPQSQRTCAHREPT